VEVFAVSNALRDVASALVVDDVTDADRAAVVAALSRYSLPLLARTAAEGCRIRPLAGGERYRDASATLRRLGVDVDGWPVPPAGLFVVEERTVYLRSRSRMTIGHEVGHAIDCALGGGVYLSGFDAQVRAAFAAARSFVTPYAATGLDEYMAEALRAYAGGLNDERSPWPAATPERLRACDPAMHAFVAELFASAS
jgi:hypothetical protein